ncbi:transposase-like protein, partial [Burkholderia ambifaria]
GARLLTRRLESQQREGTIIANLLNLWNSFGRRLRQNCIVAPATNWASTLLNKAIRQQKYLNNIVEQDHRAIKRRTPPMMGFKDFHCARILLGGIEMMHMIAKGQMKGDRKNQTPAEQFYSLVA